MLLTLPAMLLRFSISLTILAHSSATLTAILPHVPVPIALAIGAQVRLALPAIPPHLPIALPLRTRIRIALTVTLSRLSIPRTI